MYKAIVTAGGLGTRMRPDFAPPLNKHLFPVAGKPLIHHPLELLARSGVTDVLLILNGEHPEQILKTVDTGNDFGINVLYLYTRETFGASVGAHLLLAESSMGDEPFLLLLGDSVYFLDCIPELNTATPTHSWVMPRPQASWDDPSKYAQFPTNGSLVQTGLWLFDRRVFRAAEALGGHTSVRIRDLVTYLQARKALTSTTLPEESFIDCGTPGAVKQVESVMGT